MKRFFDDKENKISIILFVITIAVACLPLFSKYCINGHDLEYHLLRIESLKEGIIIGKPFLKVNTLFFGNAGYASSMFYSDLFMYIPALLRVMGVSIAKSYHIFVAFIFILCYGSTYFCTFKMTNNKYIASLAAVLLTLSPYHMDDMLVRAACGEYMAFVFIPFVIYGIYNVLFEDMNHPYAFAVGFGGLILTHPATFVMNVIFAVMVFIIFIKRFISKPALILKLLVTTLITLLVTSFYWMPLIEQMMVSRFIVSENYVDMLDSSLKLMDVFSSTFPGAGCLILVFLLPRIFLSKKDYPILSYVDSMILMGLLFAIASSDILPWNRLERIFSFVQFPWRFLTMTTSLLSVSAGTILVIFAKSMDEKWEKIAVLIALSLSVFLAINHNSENATGYYDYGEDYYSYAPFTANVIGGEWLPVTVTDRDVLVELSQHMIASNGEELAFTREKAAIYSDIPEGLDSVNVPFIYYKGYGARLEKTDGSIVDLRVTGEGINGICLVKLDGQGGKLKVWYKGTTIIKLSAIVSIASIAIWLLLVFLKKKGIGFLGKTVANKANIIILLLCIGFSMSLTACASGDGVYDTNVNQLLNEVNLESYEDAQNLLNVLLNEQEAKEEEEVVEEEPVYVTYNTSSKGYELEEQYFAIKVDTQSGDAKYSLVPISEAERDGAFVVRNSMVYPDIADVYYTKLVSIYADMSSTSSNVFKDKDSFKKALMHEADMLFFLEYFSEDVRADSVRKLSEMLASVLLNSSDIAENDLTLLYNTSAVLAKADYVLEDIDFSDALNERSLELFNDAEAANSDDDREEINRVWASAEIYRITGVKTYRTIVEAYEDLVNANGFTYDNPGYYACFSYLTASDSTDYSLSSQIMKGFFDRMNSEIKRTDEDILDNCLLSENFDGNTISEEFLNTLSEELKLSVIVNRISMSVEYVRYAKDRIIFLSGANPAGVDYLDSENIMNCEPVLSALLGVRTY